MKPLLFSLCACTLASLCLLAVSCARQEQPAAEQPPARGQRDRVMSELHATRKQILDALAKISDERLKMPMSEGAPSASEAVEALIIRERRLLTAMGTAPLPAAAHPLENESLSNEDRGRLAAQEQADMKSKVEGCVAQMQPSSFQVIPNPANLGKGDLEQGIKVARGDLIAFARETNYSFLRRTIKDDKCGEMNLGTAMMLQAALTEKVAGMVNQAASEEAK